MITVTIVEGDKDLYFFYYVLLVLKNSYPIDARDSSTLRSFYTYYSNVENKIILQHNGDYIILIHNNNKKNAIRTFVTSINDFLRNDVPIHKISLMIDSDTDNEIDKKILSEISKIQNLFKDELSISTPSKREHLLELSIKRYSKNIELGFIPVEPSLEVVMSDFIKKYTDLPAAKKSGGADEIIKNAKEYWNQDSIEKFCEFLIKNFKKELDIELSRINIKTSMCYMF